MIENEKKLIYLILIHLDIDFLIFLVLNVFEDIYWSLALKNRIFTKICKKKIKNLNFVWLKSTLKTEFQLVSF